LGGVSWLPCGGLLRLLYVIGATWVEGTKYQCKWKVHKAGLWEAKYWILIVAMWLCGFCFWVLENNCLWDECPRQSNYCSFVFHCARSLVWLLGVDMDMHISKAHERW
jgi:hypothetical protein